MTPDPRRVFSYPSSGYWRLAAIVTVALLTLGTLVFGAYVMTVYWQTPSLHELQEVQASKPSVLRSADGVTLTTFRRERQERVPLDRISPRVVQALIATEDHRFFEHGGVDLRRTTAAVLNTLSGDTQGGSTLTQQLARNLFPEEIGRAPTIHRKLKELFTALRIEEAYSKQQIIESYLNTVPFLYNVVGIEMAARTYYDTTAAELDALQAATLVGMLKGTHSYNPVRYPERAQKRRNLVLAQMVKQGDITQQEHDVWSPQPLNLQFNRETESLGSAPHFAAHARKWLADWAEDNGHDLYADGLVIETTLDSQLQQVATRAVAEQTQALQQVADVEWSARSLPVATSSIGAYAKAARQVDPFAYFWKQQPDVLLAALRDAPEFRKRVKAGLSEEAAARELLADAKWLAELKARKTRLEAGFLAIDPSNGEIKAWVGSRDFAADQYDHVAQAQRQPGSTFKPFVYGAALEAGIGPQRTYVDQAVEVPLGNGKFWRPTDMAGATGRPMSLRDGLVFSKNTITAQVMQEVGVARIASLAQAMGVNLSPLDRVPSLALGTSPVTLLEMVSAYATIARQGMHHPPIFIKRITDREGRELASFGGGSRRALSDDSAIELTDMMRGAVSRGTGTAIKTRFGIVADIAGKTGTTQNNTDGWFILMHPQLVAGAWVGFNDSRVTMRSNHWGQGGHNAILLVGDFFREALKTGAVDPKAVFPPSRLTPPEPMRPWPGEPWAAEQEGEPATEGQPSDAVGGVDAGADVDPMKDRAELDQLLDRLARQSGQSGPSGQSGQTGQNQMRPTNGVSPSPAALPASASEGALTAPLRMKAEAVGAPP